MCRLLKTRNATDENGKVIQHALYDCGASFKIFRWEEACDTNELLEEIGYEGYADRKAAQAMALGCLDSLHRLVLEP